MRRVSLALATTLLLALLAGCTDGGDSESPDGVDGADGVGGAGTGTAADADADGLEDGTTPWREVAFSESGTTRTSLCLPNVGGGCSGPILVGPDGTTIELDGRQGRVTATLDWDDGPTPLDDLALHFAAYSSCGSGCWTYRQLERAAGPPPVVLDTDTYTLEGEEQGFALMVSDAAALTPSPAYSDVDVAVAFTVEGTAFLR